jgi:polar amino acid transport system permease protein
MKSRRERLGLWWTEQTLVSSTVLLVGIASVFVGFLVSVIHFWIEDFTPYDQIVTTATSQRQASIWWVSIFLGLVAAIASVVSYRRQPNKSAKEATVSGGVLGIQTALFSGFLLWFQTGDKFEVFVKQFMSFDLLPEFFDQFVNGAKNTLLLAFLGQAIGMLIGLFFAMLILSDRVAVRAPARLYINVIRGTPLLVQLSIGYFGLALGLGLNISVFSMAALILGLNAGAYSAEIFRAGIQSLERGQLEASRSLGLSYGQSMTYVIVPQAVRRVIPPLMNEFVILIKDTSLVVILGLTFSQRELLAVGRDAYAELYNATPYVASALGYLIVTLPLIRVVTYLEKKLRSGLVGIGA